VLEQLAVDSVTEKLVDTLGRRWPNPIITVRRVAQADDGGSGALIRSRVFAR